MYSPDAQRAIEDAQRHGKALLKFISPNDTGLTGGHQCGFYLPVNAWQHYTVNPPDKGRNAKSPARITWQDGRVTNSVVTWYGQKTRSEYRLTRFGPGFPWLTHDLVGALFVLIPITTEEFLAYVLDRDDDVEDIQAALGVYVTGSWALYVEGEDTGESLDECMDRLFREFTQLVDSFPETRVMSLKAREAVYQCMKGFENDVIDKQLLTLVRSELRLFDMVERKVYGPEITRPFRNIDDFVKKALSILNARKSRAGRALENHMEHLLREAKLPFEMRAKVEGTRPDILMPGKKAYEEALRGDYPKEKLIMVGLKTTCKERWPGVLSEAPLIERKHLLTLQEGMAASLLERMKTQQIVLVVPRPLHEKYAGEGILDVAGFIEEARRILS
jgi:hypothetical protein